MGHQTERHRFGRERRRLCPVGVAVGVTLREAGGPKQALHPEVTGSLHLPRLRLVAAVSTGGPRAVVVSRRRRSLIRTSPLHPLEDLDLHLHLEQKARRLDVPSQEAKAAIIAVEGIMRSRHRHKVPGADALRRPSLAALLLGSKGRRLHRPQAGIRPKHMWEPTLPPTPLPLRRTDHHRCGTAITYERGE